LLGTWYLRGAGGDPSVANPRPITLLHLSDPQFGPHHRFEGPASPGGFLHRLRDDLARLRAEEGVRPDLVLLTGDLVEHGLKSQFEELYAFAHGISEVTELAPRRVVMVPGNHDINWKLSEAYFAERAGHEEQPRPPYWPKLKPYAELFARFYEGQTGIGFTEEAPWSLFEVPDLGVVIAGLNSAIAESHRSEDHYGFLGEEQLRFFAGKLRPYKEQGLLRIAAVHHDPLHPENEAARQDAKDFKRMLLPYLNLVVHGHIHEEQLGWLDNHVPVLGIGSAGVKAPARPPEVPDRYQLVQVYPHRLVYGTRTYVPDQKRWIGCLRSDPNGRAWRIEKRVPFERVEGTFSGRTEAVAAPLADLAQRVDAYRRHWADAYRREALFNLTKMGEDADIPAGLDLLHVFLPQTARREPPRLDLPRDLGGELDERREVRDPSRRGRTPADERKLGLTVTGPPLPIDEVLTSPGEPWVLILGAPGAGKSALTRWLVLKLCTPGEALGGLPADVVPVRVELRRFDLSYRKAREAGRSYDFFDHLDEIHRERQLSLHGEPLRRLAASGRLLWLFDGLDEVADPHARRDYAAMIVGLRERYAGRGVVTSRIVGARPAQPLFEQVGIATYTLQDFEERQIGTFLERWHQLAFPNAPEAGAQRLERLRRTLAENRPVRELCGNPLLLTLIALLSRGAELPRQRHQLYERAVELMADQWDANKHLSAANVTRFDLSAKKRFLRKLAFSMMTELPHGSGNTIKQRDLVDFATAFCAREYALKPEEAQATGEQLIQHLRERNYVLTLLGGQTFGFVHKTFLEYLAAADIEARFRAHKLGLDEIKGGFRQRWQDQAWKETLTLICGMIGEERPEQVIEILQEVLKDEGPFSEYDLGPSVALALRCLDELRTLDQEPMRGFVRGLTDWIFRYFNEWGDFPEILSTLRMRGSEWPEADRFLAAMFPESASHDIDSPGPLLVRCAIAVGGKQERVAQLAKLVSGNLPKGYVLLAIDEAHRFDEWTEIETALLPQIVQAIPEPERLDAWVALLKRGLAAAGAPVLDVLRSSRNPKMRATAAQALLSVSERRDEAANTLVDILHAGPPELIYLDGAIQSLLEAASAPALRDRVISLLHAKNFSVRRTAARQIALHWRDMEAVSLWLEGVFDEHQHYGDFRDVDIGLVRELIENNRSAQGLLASMLENPSAVQNLDARHAIARWLADHGDPRGVSLLREVAESTSTWATTRHRFATALLDVPFGQRFGVDALVQIAQHNAEPRFIAAWCTSALAEHAEVVPEARAGLFRLAREGSNERLRYLASIAVLSLNLDDTADAMKVLHQLAASATDETVRIDAATHLRDAGLPASEWRPVLAHLARSARRGSTRLRAAKELRDETRIARIAAHARSPRVRKNAADALERLRLYHALLQVGRPRRGVVSLDGTRVGLIEETPHGMRFLYDRAYLDRPGVIPLSPTLPLRREPHDHRGGLHPFFENLLPEGWLLDQTCRKLGLDRTDAFGLLLATCADCAGAVEVVPEKLLEAA
jgi:HipA-like protein